MTFLWPGDRYLINLVICCEMPVNIRRMANKFKCIRRCTKSKYLPCQGHYLLGSNKQVFLGYIILCVAKGSDQKFWFVRSISEVSIWMLLWLKLWNFPWYFDFVGVTWLSDSWRNVCFQNSGCGSTESCNVNNGTFNFKLRTNVLYHLFGLYLQLKRRNLLSDPLTNHNWRFE